MTLANPTVERARYLWSLVDAPRSGWRPRTELGAAIFRALPYVPRDLAEELIEKISRVGIIETALRARVIRGDGAIEDYGVVSRRLVTNNGVAFIVDAWGNTTELENMKFHGIGTGTNAEAAGDSALQTELTTQYNPDNTRATGSLAEAAANIFQTVGTNTLDSGTPAVTEHGILSQAATGGGVLLDRSVFAAINLVGANGDGLQTDYRITFTAGG